MEHGERDDAKPDQPLPEQGTAPSSESLESLIGRLELGDEDAGPRLFELLYAQLYALAKSRMRCESAGHTLQPTALLNEAYLRLFGRENPTFQNLEHFLALTARAMRSVLVDHARKKKAARRTAPGARVDASEIFVLYENTSVDILELDAALERFRAFAPDSALILELRYFAGGSLGEISTVMKISERTTERELRAAKAWLAKEMSR